ncbi:MAG: hypothetical protein K9I36_07335 [Bacteroidia bacterium]|nr:hypothetical protein [Bacteroidia bacterium]MCF8426528.1 hypothetical protein [Bacteroidia bacterium]
MVIERNENEIIIRINSGISAKRLEQLVDYLRYREIADKSKAKKADLDKLISSVKKKRHLSAISK